jgi:hypothetical protein
MKKLVAMGFVFTLLVFAVGCSGSSTTPPPAPQMLKGEAEVKELLKLQKDGEELAKKDPAKALEMLPKIMEIAKKLEDLKLTEAEQKALVEKYPDLEKGKGPHKDKKDDKK